MITIEQNDRKCGQKLHTLVSVASHVTFVAMETRSLKTGLAKPFVWQHSQLWRNDNKQILILLPKMSWFRLRNKCCRAGGARNRNSRPGTRTKIQVELRFKELYRNTSEWRYWDYCLAIWQCLLFFFAKSSELQRVARAKARYLGKCLSTGWVMRSEKAQGRKFSGVKIPHQRHGGQLVSKLYELPEGIGIGLKYTSQTWMATFKFYFSFSFSLKEFVMFWRCCSKESHSSGIPCCSSTPLWRQRRWPDPGPESTGDLAGPKFRVQQTGPSPMHGALDAMVLYWTRLFVIAALRGGGGHVNNGRRHSCLWSKNEHVDPNFVFLNSKRNLTGNF